MPLINSPIPQSPLARSRRLAVAEPVTICDLEATAGGDSTADVVATNTDEVAPRALEQPADTDELTRRALELKSAVYDRLLHDGRWTRLNLAGVRNDMMRDCTRGKRMHTIEAQIWTYSEIDRLYPPEPNLTEKQDERVAGVSSLLDGGDVSSTVDTTVAGAREGDYTANGHSVTERVTQLPQSAPESSRLQGLGDVPPAWLPLPANASLEAEIRWVQANRLYVVEERGNTTIVHLDRAHEPAPSRAAIGWLETSIRSYAKYVDVVGKYLGVESDEASVVRRERMAIAEIRSLLDEMHAD